MKTFARDLSLRAKLLAGFGAVLALTAVLGFTLLSQLGSVNQGGEWLGAHAVPKLEQLATIGQDVADLRRAQMKYVLTGVASAKASARSEWESDARAANVALAAYGRGLVSSADRGFFDSFKAHWSALLEQTAPLAGLAASGAASSAGQANISSSLPTYLATLSTLRGWLSANGRWAQARVAGNRSTYGAAQLLGIVLIAAALLLGLGIALVLSSSIKRAVDVVLDRTRMLQDKCLTYLRDGMVALADGDLSRSYVPVTPVIENPSGDEIGQIATAVNGLRERIIASLEAYNETAARLRGTIGHVADAASSVGASSEEMAATSEEAGKASGEIAQAVTDIAGGAERQVRMIEQARRSAEEVARAVAESAENAQVTARLAGDAREVAQAGVGAAEQADQAMRSVRDSSAAVTETIGELAAKSEQIGRIVQTITGIAEQTNLLALNAAIEAARAGEQGRGFAVVAEEVRKLAEESQRAAQEISGLIGQVQTETGKAVAVVQDGAKRTEDGVNVVDQTRQAFVRIGGSVQDISARIEQLATVAEQIAAAASTMQESIGEVAAVAQQSSASTEEVSASTEQSSASAQEIAASAQDLSGRAEELTRLVAQFKLSA